MDRRPPGNIKNIYKKQAIANISVFLSRKLLELLHAVTRIYAQVA